MVMLIAMEAPSIGGHGKAAAWRREINILAITRTVSAQAELQRLRLSW